jgi:translocation and assembly module TamB
LFSVPGETAAQTNLDLSVRAENTIRVDTNIFRGRVSADLHLSGDLRVPIMTGRVSTEGGTLRLPVTEVNLEQLVVEFPPASPFEPTVDARGGAQLRGYDLQVHASGTVPAIEIQVSSSPTLPQDQALLLLSTGYADVGGLEAGERTVRALGRYVGEQLLDVFFGETRVEGLLIDRVNVAVGRRVSSTGSDVIEVEYQLGAGERWYLEFERDRYDEYNVGVSWKVWIN